MKTSRVKKGLVCGIILLFVGASVVPIIRGNNDKMNEINNKNYEKSVISTEGSISGYVYQVNGNPISGATVEVIRQDENGWWVTSTAPNGSYNVAGLPTGDYKVRAFKHGYAREYYDNVFYSSMATIVHVIAPGEITDIDFNLNQGGSISGKVYDQSNGTPISGADIFARPSSYFFDDGFHAVTDSNGSYTVEGFALGNYKVLAEASGYAKSRYYDGVYGWDNADNVMVIPPNSTSDINISLELAGIISGSVFAIDGITPIPNVGLIADPTIGNFEGIGGVSGDNGSYTITGLPPDNYTVRTGEDMPNWYAGEFYDSKYTWSTADRVPVTAGTVTTNIIFSLDEGGWITGGVFDEETGDPISGVQLGACLLNGDGVTPSPLTGYDGSYKFVLREGTYLIHVGFSSGYVPEWYNDSYDMDNATPVNVTFHNDTSQINFYLTKAGVISGHVYSEDGNPINDASVFAFSKEFPGNGAFCGEDGSYRIEGLPSGDYLVQVTVSGYFSEYFNNVTDPADATLVTVQSPEDTPNINFNLTQRIGVYISRPKNGYLYIFDREIMPTFFGRTVIIGRITVKAVAFGSEKVEFYVNGVLKETDNESPFWWLLIKSCSEGMY